VYATLGGFAVAFVDCLLEEVMAYIGAWTLGGGTYLFGFNVPIEIFFHFVLYGIFIGLIANPEDSSIYWLIFVVVGLAGFSTLFDYASTFFGVLIFSSSMYLLWTFLVWLFLNSFTLWIVWLVTPSKERFDEFCIENKDVVCEA
jgi:hypothetical protein